MLRKIIDRPVAVTMMTIVIIVIGLVCLRFLPISLIPDIDIPYITVQAESAGMSSREMDRSVLSPLRGQLMQIDGLEDIRSDASDGKGTIRLTFNHGDDMDLLFIEVNEKIDRSMAQLPDIPRPKVMKASATDIPAYFINVTGKDGTPFLDISRFSRDLVRRRIEQLPEVAMVDISGTVSDEILITPDKEKLQQAGITLADFEECIKEADVQLGSLTIRDGQYRYNVRFDSKINSADAIAEIWFLKEGRLLQIKDVASVKTQPAKRTGLVRSDGEQAVCLAIVKQSDARMSDLRKAMDSLLAQFSEDYPQLNFTVTRDQTTLLDYSIRSLLQNILAAIFFACIIIFLFMKDFRSPALVVLTMPTALIFSFLGFRIAGMSLNIISLSGLLLGVGMMTDNAIILVENITGRWQRGDSLRNAVIEGTREVTAPMLSSILTTCAVFVPLVFLKGMAGSLFKDQAFSVTIVLLASWLITITVIPVYYWQWFKKKESFTPSEILQRLSLDELLRKWDAKWLAWSLNKPWFSHLLLTLSFVGIIVLFPAMPKERLPEMTVTDTILDIVWNEPLSLEQNEDRITEVENLIDGEKNQITALVGSQQFLLSHSGDQTFTEASVYIDCGNAAALEKVKERIGEFLSSRWPSAVISFRTSGNVFDMAFASDEATLSAHLRPIKNQETELSTLRPLISSLRRNLPDVNFPDPSAKTDIMFVADPELMALYGISYPQLISLLRNSLNENRLFSILQGMNSIPVVTGTDAGTLTDILERTFIESTDEAGSTHEIPVSLLMRQTAVEELRTIVAGSEGNFYPLDLDIEQSSVKKVMDSTRETVRTDGNYEVSFSGAWFSNRDLVKQMIFILIIALVLLYLILASQFESLVQPFIILSEIVIDIFASVLVLRAFGVSINLMSLIGLVVISGIVINDSILKIDSINRLVRSGESLRDAIMTASSRRMKAIIMTSLTTIFAVFPFLARGSMGADLQYPMSLVIISGMVVGTLVSLFVVPVLYFSIYHGRKK